MAVCVALKAHLGWLNSVAVTAGLTQPEPAHVERLRLFTNQPREVVEPYHVAGGWQGLKRVPRPAEPDWVIAEGRKKQVTSTKRCLRAFRKHLEREGLEWAYAVVLVGRGWLGHSLSEILDSHAHIHVYEGEAVRDATRTALDALGIPWADLDEKSVVELASRHLKIDDPDAYMKTRRPSGTRSWAKEERLLALAAWVQETSR